MKEKGRLKKVKIFICSLISSILLTGCFYSDSYNEKNLEVIDYKAKNLGIINYDNEFCYYNFSKILTPVISYKNENKMEYLDVLNNQKFKEIEFNDIQPFISDINLDNPNIEFFYSYIIDNENVNNLNSILDPIDDDMIYQMENAIPYNDEIVSMDYFVDNDIDLIITDTSNDETIESKIDKINYISNLSNNLNFNINFYIKNDLDIENFNKNNGIGIIHGIYNLDLDNNKHFSIYWEYTLNNQNLSLDIINNIKDSINSDIYFVNNDKDIDIMYNKNNPYITEVN